MWIDRGASSFFEALRQFLVLFSSSSTFLGIQQWLSFYGLALKFTSSTLSLTAWPAAPASFKPLPFNGAGDMDIIGRGVHRCYPMRDYGYLGERPLLEWNHVTKWVQTKLTNMTDFREKGYPSPELGLEFACICRIVMPSDKRLLLVILISLPLYMTWSVMPPGPCSTTPEMSAISPPSLWIYASPFGCEAALTILAGVLK